MGIYGFICTICDIFMTFANICKFLEKFNKYLYGFLWLFQI